MNSSSSIGYTISDIGDLCGRIAEGYKQMGEAMSGGWSTVQRTLKSNWVGVDENQFESNFATTLCNIYFGCRDIVAEMITILNESGYAWQGYQIGNAIKMGMAPVSGPVKPIDEPIDAYLNKYDFDIRSNLKAERDSFNASTKMGIVDGTASLSIITSSVDAYLADVQEKITNIFTREDLSACQGFMGTVQITSLDTAIEKLTELSARCITCIDDDMQTLANMVSGYAEQEAEVAKFADSKASSIDLSNIGNVYTGSSNQQ